MNGLLQNGNAKQMGDDMDIEFLKLLKRITLALEALAENTKPVIDERREFDPEVRGFKVGGTD